MNTGYTVLRRALLKIAEISDRAWRNSAEEPLQGAYHYWDLASLERTLPESDDRLEIPPPCMRRRLFVLPPTGRSVSGFLAVNWQFVAEQDDSRHTSRVFRIFLTPSDVKQVTPTVVRFDEKEDETTWRFPHAQLCDRMAPYDEHFAEGASGSWISATLPRIPLPATQGPAPILVCLLVGLYGVDSPLLTSVLRVLHDRDSRTTAKHLGWTG